MTRTRFVLTFALATAAVTGLWAQGNRNNENATTRTVQGTVTGGDDQPVTGAVVQIKDLKSLQVRSFITRENGAYQFQALNPNVDYELKADHQGTSSGVKVLSTFDSRRNAVINLKLQK